jgi:lysophospholipase L1-like esterase
MKCPAVLVAAIFLGTSVLALAAPRPFVTVINPSFEDAPVIGDTYTTSLGTLSPQTGIPGWQFGTSANDSFCGIVTEIGSRLGMPKNIPQGWQAAFLQGTGQCSQRVTFDAAGPAGRYVVRFRSLGRTSGNGGAGANTIAVTMDGRALGTFTPGTTQWTLFTSSAFNVAPGVHTLAFAGTIPYSQQDRTSYIDAVQIVTAAEAAANIPPTSPVFDIVFIGDSITAGATLADASTQSSAAQCRDSLGQRFNMATRWADQGYPGHTTVDWLPATNTDFPAAVAAAAALEASSPGRLVFSIMLGTNDSAQSGPNGAPVSPAKFELNLRAIVDELLVKFPAASIFVHYPTWYSPNTQNSSLYGAAGLARLQTYFPEIDQLISDCATAHPGLVFAGDKLAFTFFSTNYLTDLTPESGVQGTFYLHPNAAGAIALGKYWADAIEAGLHCAPNDSYGAWLQSGDLTPGAAGTGFADTPAAGALSNGLAYGAPGGLTLTAGAPASLTLTADVRADSALTAVLEGSSDLAAWSALAWSAASSQSGAPTGFSRCSFTDTISQANTGRFYHIKIIH